MAYVPKDARWFLGTMIEEFQIEGAKRNVVHINYVVIEARSPEDAYKRAIKFGKQANQSYMNTHGKMVTVKFRGLSDLDVIYDPFGHGCEIMFRERLGVSESAIRKLLVPKGRLEVFRPIRRRRGRPDYASKEIMDQYHRSLSKRTK